MVSTDLDRSMKGSKRADQMYLGPTLGMTDAQQNILRVTTGGITTIDRNITLVEVNFAGAVSIQLPTTVNVNPNLGTMVREPVTVVDVSGAAGANHITILPFSGELIIGTTGVVISTNWGSYVLNPMETGGWTLLDVNPSSIGLVTFETKADVEATLIPVLDTGLQILGYTTAGDGGEATYKKVVGMPAHGGRIQSLDGAWWEIAELVLNPIQFGAVGDDSTDNQGALATWLSCCFLQSRAGYIPRGIFRHSSTLSVSNGISISGAGRDVAILKITSATVDQVELYGGQVFSDVGFMSSVTRTAGSTVAILSNNLILRDFRIDGAFCGVDVRNTSSIIAISDGLIRDTFPATGSSILIRDGGAANYITNITCDTVPATFSHLQIISCYDVTITNCAFLRAISGIYINPTTGSLLASVRADNVGCDNCTVAGIAFAPTGTGAIARCDFTQCWFSSSGNYGVFLDDNGTASINGITFRGCHIFDNAVGGVKADGSGISNIGITDCEIAGGNIGVELIDVASARITSGKIGQTGGFSGNALGISLSGTADNVYIDGVDLTGNATTWTNTASGTNIRFNPCFNQPVPTVYTPGVTSDSGTITTLGTVSGRYSVVGKMCHYEWDITITTNGTAAGFLKVTLPFTTANFYYTAAGANLTNGVMIQGLTVPAANYLVVRNRDATYPGADATHLVMSGEFEMA